LDIDTDYQWIAVGVPSQRYLWIMDRKTKISDTKFEEIIARIDAIGYSTKDIREAPSDVSL